MNGSKYLLDTNIILYILSGSQELTDHLQSNYLYVSFITEIELLSFQRLSISDEKSISGFLSRMRLINMDDAIKQETIALRRQYELKLPDAISAATAVSLQLTLISADKQFRQIEHLRLELYAA